MLVMMHDGMTLSTVKEYDLRQFPEIFLTFTNIPQIPPVPKQRTDAQCFCSPIDLPNPNVL